MGLEEEPKKAHAILGSYVIPNQNELIVKDQILVP